MTFNIAHVRGETFRLVVSIPEDDGTPVDLTGAAVEMRLAPALGAAPVAAQVSGGTIAASVDRDAAALWPLGRHGASLWAVWPDGAAVEAERLFPFTITVSEDLV